MDRVRGNPVSPNQMPLTTQSALLGPPKLKANDAVTLRDDTGCPLIAGSFAKLRLQIGTFRLEEQP